jgi:ubiquinone/menaquinone biosynthesis C-methylase UbiE
VDPREAEILLERAVAGRSGAWVDLGAGDGTFTRALARGLGSGSRVIAVDRDSRALARLNRLARAEGLRVTTLVADFTRPFEWPDLGAERLDGMLFANSLHYVREPATVLERLVRVQRPGGRVVIVEYDRRRANRWVPYPIDSDTLPAIARAAGLADPIVTARAPSAFGGELYVAVMDLPT